MEKGKERCFCLDYMTPEQAALKWGISRRSVRQYLEKDRIPGVTRINHRILIPENAEKPLDRRKKNSAAANSAPLMQNPFVITVASFLPGEADNYLKAVEDEALRTIGLAELAYYRGNIALAEKLTASLDNSKSPVNRIGALMIRVLTSLLNEDINRFITNYTILTSIAKTVSALPDLKTTGHFFQLFLDIIINNNSDIVFPEVGLDAFDVTAQLQPMAIYAYAKWLILNDDIGRGIGLAEGALMFMEPARPIASIYLLLIICQGYIAKGALEKARYFFTEAWNRAQPDGIIMPFAEFRFFLGGMLEKCLRRAYPEEFKKIVELSSVYFTNWSYAHNLMTGSTVTDKLSPVEYYVATLAASGASNDSISAQLDISVNSVRTHLRNIFNKLGIDSRKELINFVAVRQ